MELCLSASVDAVHMKMPCDNGRGHADWTIALLSTQMVRALFPTGSAKLRALNAASWAFMPFQPTAVSTANIGIAEVGSPSANAAHQRSGFLPTHSHAFCQNGCHPQVLSIS